MYLRLTAELEKPCADVKGIQEQMTSEPRYNASKRGKRKYTAELDERLRDIDAEERVKTRLMGAQHKQKLTNMQIHAKLLEEGYEISLATVRWCTII